MVATRAGFKPKIFVPILTSLTSSDSQFFSGIRASMKIANRQESNMRARIFANLLQFAEQYARCKGSLFTDTLCDLEVSKSSFYYYGASLLNSPPAPVSAKALRPQDCPLCN